MSKKDYSKDERAVIEQIAKTLEFADKWCQLPKWKPGDPKIDIYGTNIGYASYMHRIQGRIIMMCEKCPHSIHHTGQWLRDGVEMTKDEIVKVLDECKNGPLPKGVHGIPAHRTCQKVKEIKSCYHYRDVVKMCPIIDEKDRSDFDYYVEDVCHE